MLRTICNRWLNGSESGAATTEFALSSIVLVPLMFYAFYFQDVVYHHLEVQEAVISSAWDYSQFNRNNVDGESGTDRRKWDDMVVSRMSRYVYSDHTSAVNPFDDLPGNKKGDHHFSSFAHACWMYPGRQDYAESMLYQEGGEGQSQDLPNEIICRNVSRNATSSGWTGSKVGESDRSWITAHPASALGNDTFGHGGTAACFAKAMVYNYLIPHNFLDKFGGAKTALFPKDTTNGQAESDGSGGTRGKSSSNRTVGKIGGHSADLNSGDGTTNVHKLANSSDNHGAKTGLVVKDQAGIIYDTFGLYRAKNGSDGQGSSEDFEARPLWTADAKNSSTEFYRRVNKLYQGTLPGVQTATYALILARLASMFSTGRNNDLINMLFVPYMNEPAIIVTGFPNPAGTYVSAKYSASNLSNTKLDDYETQPYQMRPKNNKAFTARMQNSMGCEKFTLSGSCQQ